MLKIDDDEITDLVPCLYDVRKFEKPRTKFGLPDLITKELQNEIMILADVLALFDTVFDAFGNASYHMDKSAKIVNGPYF